MTNEIVIATNVVSTLRQTVEGQNVVSIQSLLKYIAQRVLPKLTKSDFSDPKVADDFEGVLKSVSEIGTQGLLDVDIKEAKAALAVAQLREPK